MKVSLSTLLHEAFDALDAGRMHVENATRTRDRNKKKELLLHVRDVLIPSLSTTVNRALARLEGV